MTVSLCAGVLFASGLLVLAKCFSPRNCSDVQIKHGNTLDGRASEYGCFDNLPVLDNNSEVIILSSFIHLAKVVEFSDIMNLKIIGMNNPVINCYNSTPSGLSFRSILNLEIRNIEFQFCANELMLSKDSYRNIKASVVIRDSANVFISELSVLNGQGTGLALFDIKEELAVLSSTFEGNGHDRISGGNGVYLEISASDKSLGSSIFYNFTDCKFLNNHAVTEKDNNISGFSRFDKGGGLCFFMRGQSNVSVVVENATILGNTASTFGGGIFASYSNNASDSIFTLRNSQLSSNRAAYGGAHYSGYLHNQYLGQKPLNCGFVFEENMFTHNSALYGGAVSVFSTPTDAGQQKFSNTVKFNNCKWQFNSALFGSAVSILPNAWNIHKEGFLPTFYFIDCTIDSNFIQSVLDQDTGPVKEFSRGSGAVYCTDHKLNFNNTITFRNNNGSALYLGSCQVHFREFSNSTFINNTGYYGGAIFVLSSLILLDENIRLSFISNTAYSKGGALYQNSFNFHMYNYSRTCFFREIHSSKKELQIKNRTIKFEDNYAGNRNGGGSMGYGHSMYMYSLLPCCRFYRFFISGLEDVFSTIGNFTYHPTGRPSEIATDARRSMVTSEDERLPILPGKEEFYPYYDVDDFKHNITGVYFVTVQDSDSSDSIKVNHAHRYVSTSKVKLFGNGSREATVVMSALASQQRTLYFRIRVQQCPPGFVLAPEEDSWSCKCGKEEYYGLQNCRDRVLTARRLQGVWFGYKKGANESEDTLLTGHCPIGFCDQSKNRYLPKTADRDLLNAVICQGSRTGVLCGLCKTGYSVYCHSGHFLCKINKHCKWGWLFYILSEILPVTILFFVIIFFKINFTSGMINGFIFYSQVVSTLRISAGGLIPFPNVAYKVILFLYLHFNLTPLVLDEISFCLFENANTLDVISFNYITLVYSLFLIVGIIVVTNKLNTRCSCKTISRLKLRRNSFRGGSMVHGLSALLVLCYAKCTLASLMIIIYGGIRTKGPHIDYIAVFFNGEIQWFSTEHLPYAIPAVIMLCFIVLMPIVLLVYPLHYKIISLLKLSDNKVINFVFSPLERLKPLLDSFQGSFKDEFRFFSGLYFVYRLFLLLNATLSNIESVYFILLGQLLFILLLHSVCQPYKRKLHNIIDTLLFFNLIVINGLTMYNVAQVTGSTTDTKVITVLSVIQTLLVIIPLLVVGIVLMVRATPWKVFNRCKSIKQNADVVVDDEFPVRELYNLSTKQNYKRMT